MAVAAALAGGLTLAAPGSATATTLICSGHATPALLTNPHATTSGHAIVRLKVTDGAIEQANLQIVIAFPQPTLRPGAEMALNIKPLSVNEMLEGKKLEAQPGEIRMEMIQPGGAGEIQFAQTYVVTSPVVGPHLPRGDEHPGEIVIQREGNEGRFNASPSHAAEGVGYRMLLPQETTALYDFLAGSDNGLAVGWLRGETRLLVMGVKAFRFADYVEMLNLAYDNARREISRQPNSCELDRQ